MASLLFFRNHFLKDASRYAYKHPFVKFLVVLAVFLAYLGFTVFRYGFEQGIMVAILTWSFFVFCTPVADAGALVDFPVRLLTGIRMIYSECLVWIIAALFNAYALIFAPQIYSKTILLSLFKHILSQPIPYGIIILLSGVGTFLSVHFADELLDVVSSRKNGFNQRKRHIKKFRLVVFLFLIAVLVTVYHFLLNELGINIPLM